MKTYSVIFLFGISIALGADLRASQQVTVQDIDKILERADKLLDEAKAGYEEATAKASVSGFVDAGFKLEEARIKYLVLQEIGSAEKQKLAADRLRAVNQLSKLIHDGKVAVGGTPAEPAPPKPADPPAGTKNPPANPPAPAKAVDVTKRAQVPEAAKLKDAEKSVKDLFKDQYAKKSPTDRKELAQLLMAQAVKSQDDLNAMWVLCREAQDVAVQGGDARTAVEAIEWAARFFDLDALAMKSAAISGVGKLAKTTDEYEPLTEELLKLIDEFIAVDQYDAADKAVSNALQFSKKSGDSVLVLLVTTRSKEVAEAKTLFQGMKGNLDTLAKNPDDAPANTEMGKFLCYVHGAWDLGLRFLVKGSDPALKAVAEKELNASIQAADRLTLADGWYEMAEKEKSPLRKSQMYNHSKVLYESSLVDATALSKAKIQKRLEDLDRIMSGPAGIDLMRLIDLRKDSVCGGWSIDRGRLSLATYEPWARFQIPYIFPDEYDLRVSARTTENALGFRMVLPFPAVDRNCFLNIGVDNGTKVGLDLLDGKLVYDPSNPSRSPMVPVKAATVLISVRKSGMLVAINGKKVLEWKEYGRLANHPPFNGPNKNTVLFSMGQDSKAQIEQVRLITVSGQGKRLR